MRVGAIGLLSSGCPLVWALDPGVRYQLLPWVDLRSVGFVLITIAVILLLAQVLLEGWRSLGRFGAESLRVEGRGGITRIQNGDQVRTRQRVSAGR